MSQLNIILIAGDLITLLIVTWLGFYIHGTLDTAGERVLPTLIPVLVSWLIFLPPFKGFSLEIAGNWKQLWRPFWAMVLAGPFASWMRSVWLNRTIVPIFVVVLGGFSAIGLLVWRFLFWIFWVQKTRVKHG